MKPEKEPSILGKESKSRMLSGENPEKGKQQYEAKKRRGRKKMVERLDKEVAQEQKERDAQEAEKIQKQVEESFEDDFKKYPSGEGPDTEAWEDNSSEKENPKEDPQGYMKTISGYAGQAAKKIWEVTKWGVPIAAKKSWEVTKWGVSKVVYPVRAGLGVITSTAWSGVKAAWYWLKKNTVSLVKEGRASTGFWDVFRQFDEEKGK